jgi:hypothetical protein
MMDDPGLTGGLLDDHVRASLLALTMGADLAGSLAIDVDDILSRNFAPPGARP